MGRRLIPKDRWKPKAGAVAGAAVVTGIFVTGSAPPTEQVVPIAAHAEASVPIGRGYWLVTSNGKVYAYGDAKLYGDMAGRHLDLPIVGIIPPRTARAIGWSPGTAAFSPLGAPVSSAA